MTATAMIPRVLGLLLLLPLALPAAERPNILLIVSDDQGYPDLGCIGTKPVLTPNLDRLAAEGVRATSFYVAWPACTPSRGSLLTGRYPQRNGLYDMIRNDMVNYGHRYTPEEYAVSPEMTLGLDVRERRSATCSTARGIAPAWWGNGTWARRAGFCRCSAASIPFMGTATTASTTTRMSVTGFLRCS